MRASHSLAITLASEMYPADQPPRILKKTKPSDLEIILPPKVVHDLEENLDCAIALIHVEEDGWIARFEAIAKHLFP